jgi:hypothetical protein
MKEIKYYTSIDLVVEYWHIEIEEKNKEKTNFICAINLFEFNVLLFGLNNAPVYFNKMDEIVEEINWQVGSNYLNDLIIELLNFKNHINYLKQIFQRLSLFGFSTKLSKYYFFKQILNYLGHKISSKKI